MIEEFNSKLKSKQYISNYLYEKIKEENRVPEEFNLEEYNKEILDKMYTDNKEYFEGMYKGNPGVKIEAPLYAHEDDGSYSKEVRRMFGEVDDE